MTQSHITFICPNKHESDFYATSTGTRVWARGDGPTTNHHVGSRYFFLVFGPTHALVNRTWNVIKMENLSPQKPHFPPKFWVKFAWKILGGRRVREISLLFVPGEDAPLSVALKRSRVLSKHIKKRYRWDALLRVRKERPLGKSYHCTASEMKERLSRNKCTHFPCNGIKRLERDFSSYSHVKLHAARRTRNADVV